MTRKSTTVEDHETPRRQLSKTLAEKHCTNNMGTRTALGRKSVWTHNTNYPGAVGLHHENGRGAHARDAIIKRDFSSVIGTIEAIHRKELQTLKFNQRSLRNSMIAYTEKMRKISHEKFAMDATRGEKPDTMRKWSSLSRLTEKSNSTLTSAGSNPGRSQPTIENSDEVLSDRYSPASVLTTISGTDTASVTSSAMPSSKRKISEDASQNPSSANSETPRRHMRKDRRRLSPIRNEQQVSTTQSPRRRWAVTEPPNVADLDTLEESSDTSPERYPNCPLQSYSPEFIEHELHENDLELFSENDSDEIQITPFPKITIEEPSRALESARSDNSTNSHQSHKSHCKQKAPQRSRSTSKPTVSQISPKIRTGVRFKQRPKSDTPVLLKDRGRPKTPPPKCHFRYSQAMEEALDKLNSPRQVDKTDSKDSDANVLAFLDTDVLQSLSRPTTDSPDRRKSLSLPSSPQPNVESLSDDTDDEPMLTLKSVLRKQPCAHITNTPKKTVQFKLPEIITISPRPSTSSLDDFEASLTRQSDSTVTIMRFED